MATRPAPSTGHQRVVGVIRTEARVDSVSPRFLLPGLTVGFVQFHGPGARNSMVCIDLLLVNLLASIADENHEALAHGAEHIVKHAILKELKAPLMRGAAVDDVVAGAAATGT